jgi:hypothetical protein
MLAGGQSDGLRSQNGSARQRSGDPTREQRAFDRARHEDSTIGALAAVNYIIHALRELPGRKALILFSDGFSMFGNGDDLSVVEQVHRLTDLANRCAVVIYTVDARGLQTLSYTAADAGPPPRDGGLAQSMEFAQSQEGLEYLARQTGGFFVRNNNDLAGGVRRVLNDLSGYYLIGYRPEEASFAAGKGYRQFHKIQVNVRVRGLQVCSRTGYLGIPDDESRPVYRTSHEELLARLVSPFTSGDLKLRLTCLYSEVPKAGAVVRSLLYVDPHDFTYTEAADGFHNTKFDIVVFAFGEQGNVAGSADLTLTARLTPEQYSRAMRTGFIFSKDVKVEKPGGYQVRAAVRDTASDKVGSASQFIEVPDIRKHRLALSGIVLDEARPKTPDTNAAGAKEDYSIASSGSPAVRVFRTGQTIKYSYAIYNARFQSGLAEIETQLLLYRDSRPVYTGTVTPFRTGQKIDVTGLVAHGELRLGTNLEPGEYLLQVVARDKLAPQKRQLATQWTDLEIAR